MNTSINLIKKIIPQGFFPDLKTLSDLFLNNLREITLSVNKPALYYLKNDLFFVDKKTLRITKDVFDAEIVDRNTLDEILMKLTDSSPYMYENSISKGFIPFEKGIRVSISGDGYAGIDNRTGFEKINSLSFRIARNIFNVSSVCMNYIMRSSIVYNTLIISPPGCGKTTLLRDIARKLADGKNKLRIGIADERNEICIDDMGLCSLEIKGLSKEKAFDIFIRNASCDVIVADEIGGIEDAKTIFEATKRGVKIIATLHGKDYEDIKENPLSKDIYPLFETFIFLTENRGEGEIGQIYFKGEKQCLT